MGNFFTNFQVRADAIDPVLVEARRACLGRAFVAPPEGGWVAVYDEATEGQDESILRQVARGLSEGLATACFAFLVHDSDYFRFYLYERGELVDQFHSWPDHDAWAPAPGPEPDGPPGFAPDPATLFDVDESLRDPPEDQSRASFRYALPGVGARQFREALRQRTWQIIPGDEVEYSNGMLQLREFAQLLGIAEEQSCQGFKDLEGELAEQGRRTIPGLRRVRGRGKKRPEKPPASLLEAAEAGDLAGVVRFLEAGADPNMTDGYGRTALGLAVFGGHTATITALLRAGARPVYHLTTAGADPFGQGWSLLAACVSHGDPEAVRALVAAGADPNERYPPPPDERQPSPLNATVEYDWGLTPLIHAVYTCGFEASRDAPRVSKAQVDALEELIAAGEDVNARSHDGKTALIQACRNGLEGFARCLLAAGAEINGVDNHGRSPLMMAVYALMQMRSPRLVPLLLAAGADPNARDDQGATALISAAGSWDDARGARLVGQLLAAGADPNARTADGATALSIALMYNRHAIVEVLRSTGARPA